MFDLLLCILCTSSLVFAFKFFERYQVPTFQAIVVNYLTCVVIGFGLSYQNLNFSAETFSQPWVLSAMVLGSIFIGTFYLIALTTVRVGVTAASVATKISLVIPVLFSLLVLQNNRHDYTFWNYLGMALALVAVVLSSLRPTSSDQHNSPRGLAWLLLPFIVFFNSGLADSLINYTNLHFLQPRDAAGFAFLTFCTSAFIGCVALAYQVALRKQPFSGRSLLGGILLGIPNYFSIFFLVRALTAFHNDGAFLFPVNNIGIILAGTLGAVLLFRERLSRINLIGIGLAVVALVLLAYQEIGRYVL